MKIPRNADVVSPHAKSKKTENPDNSWIEEKILASEDKLMEQLAKASFDRSRGIPSDPPTDSAPPADGPLPDAVPRDTAAERRAYEELLSHLKNPDEGDADTVVEALSLDDYDKPDFEPYPANRANPEA